MLRKRVGRAIKQKVNKLLTQFRVTFPQCLSAFQPTHSCGRERTITRAEMTFRLPESGGVRPKNKLHFSGFGRRERGVK